MATWTEPEKQQSLGRAARRITEYLTTRSLAEQHGWERSRWVGGDQFVRDGHVARLDGPRGTIRYAGRNFIATDETGVRLFLIDPEVCPCPTSPKLNLEPYPYELSLMVLDPDCPLHGSRV